MKGSAARGVCGDVTQPDHTVQDSGQSSSSGASDKGPAPKAQHTDDVTSGSDPSLQYAQEHLESEILRQLEEAVDQAAVDLDDAPPTDWSPEATAQRVFDFASGLFESWCEQQSSMDEAEHVDSFEEMIRAAVDEGYAQAMDVLSGMEVEESAMEAVEETVSVLHEMFDGLLSDLRANLDEAE